jgi:hypothetical protein
MALWVRLNTGWFRYGQSGKCIVSKPLTINPYSRCVGNIAEQNSKPLNLLQRLLLVYADKKIDLGSGLFLERYLIIKHTGL